MFANRGPTVRADIRALARWDTGGVKARPRVRSRLWGFQYIGKKRAFSVKGCINGTIIFVEIICTEEREREIRDLVSWCLRFMHGSTVSHRAPPKYIWGACASRQLRHASEKIMFICTGRWEQISSKELFRGKPISGWFDRSFGEGLYSLLESHRFAARCRFWQSGGIDYVCEGNLESACANVFFQVLIFCVPGVFFCCIKHVGVKSIENQIHASARSAVVMCFVWRYL